MIVPPQSHATQLRDRLSNSDSPSEPRSRISESACQIRATNSMRSPSMTGMSVMIIVESLEAAHRLASLVPLPRPGDQRSWHGVECQAPSCGLDAAGMRAVHGDPADEQPGQNLVGVVVGEHDHSAARRGNCHVINGGYPQSAAICQMDRERDKRCGVDQFSNVRCHTMPRTVL